MDHMDTKEASIDDSTITSELINSSDTMQFLENSIQLCQKDNLFSVQNNSNSENTYTCSKNTTIFSANDSPIPNSLCEDVDSISNLQQMRPIHIPYILNGELYQIQTQDGENVTVKCCHCPPDRVYRGSVRSTGNFHMHIKRRHPDLLEKLHNMKVNALLERRDRLMRNRKVTHRGNQSRQTAIVNTNANIECSFKNENKPSVIDASTNSQIPLQSSSELSLMHTHKLKIKTVFLRHQMQQREAEMRNWTSNAEYIVMPVNKLEKEESEQPINYSLKSQGNNETLTAVYSPLSKQQKSDQHLQHEQLKEQNIGETSCNNLKNHDTSLTNMAIEKNDFCCENNASITNVSTSSISTSCPSVMSNFSSNQYVMESFQQHYSKPDKQNNLFIVKPEHFLGTENEAIDLSIHTDSGIFSTSDDDDDINEQNNKSHNICSNNIYNRAGSQKTNDTTTNNSKHNVDFNNNKNNSNNSLKWQGLLMQVEKSLRDIQREMNVRNQIESNRIFLDIAKFKFVHPGFQFNWSDFF